MLASLFSKSARLGITVLLLLLVLAPLAHSERLPIKIYATVDGLANNEVNKIVRDSRGFLWFCTGDGLSRFDGYTFANFGTDQGLPHHNVTDLLETRSGEYWIGTSGGLVRFNPRGTANKRVTSANDSAASSQMFTVVAPEDEDRAAKAISVLFEDQAGVIWCGTLKGLFRLEQKDGRFALQPVEIGMPHDYREQQYVSDLLQDRNGSLWIASSAGLYRRSPDGSCARYTERDGLPEQFIQNLFMDRAGQLWAGTRSEGLFRFVPDRDRTAPVITFSLTLKDGLPSGWVNQILQSSDGRFWAATASGLVEFFPNSYGHSKRFHVYSETNGLAYHEITTLNEDAGGNLWLGSNAGAMKLAHNGFITYGEQDGIALVNAVFGDQQGRVCFRGYVLGDGRRSVFEGLKVDLVHPNLSEPVMRLGCFDGQSFDWSLPIALMRYRDLGWVGEQVTLQSRTGEWWIGTGFGLFRFPVANTLTDLKNARPLALYTNKNGLAALQIYRLFEDSHENIWISTTASPTNGLAMWQRDTETLRDLANSPDLPAIKDNLPRSFGEDRGGNVWIGFGNGLARYRNGRFDFFTAKDGLPTAGIEYIYADQAGRLWLASSLGGLVRIDDPAADRPAFSSYTTTEGLSSNSTRVITEDLSGHIFVATGRGLDELDPATGSIKHFTTSDGLASGEILSAYRDRSGTLWFGTLKGLSRFTPAAGDVAAAAPPVLLTGLRAAGSSQVVSALGEKEILLADLPANQNQLQIDFTGLSFAPGEVLRYQYKLEPRADWSPPTEQRSLTFANLAPGQYRFLVRAVNSDGAYSSVPAVVTFRILRPLWQRWWFILFVGMFMALAVYALYRYRMSRLLEVERVRTRIATDLHDDIGAGLSRVAILTEVVKQQVADTAEQSLPLLTEIADSSRNLVSSMRDIVWAIDARHDELGDVVLRVRQFASDVLEAKGIKWDFALSAELEKMKLSPDQLRHLFLIFKEGINNTARYAACRNVSLSLAIVNHQLVGEIVDDGCGFENALSNAPSTGGRGIANMKKRAAEIGGNVTIDSAPGEGTRIRLMIPLKKR